MRKNDMQLVTFFLTKSIREKDVKFLEMNAEYSRITQNLDQNFLKTMESFSLSYFTSDHINGHPKTFCCFKICEIV